MKGLKMRFVKGWIRKRLDPVFLRWLYRAVERDGEIRPRLWHRLLAGGSRDLRRIRGIIQERAGLFFLENRKVATTSIRRAFLESEERRAELDREAKDRGMAYFRRGDMEWSIFRQKKYRNFLRKDLLHVKGLESHLHNWFRGRRRYRVSGYDEGRGFTRGHISMEELNERYYVFTFVRNPFDRLVSCFQNTYGVMQEGGAKVFSFNYEIFPYLARVKDFADFVERVSHLPYEYMDLHIVPQHIVVENFVAQGGRIDFIGHLENIEEEFGVLREKYGLLSLEKKNPTKVPDRYESWRDYYDCGTAEVVYRKFRGDFEMFGYEEEYPRLLEYIAKKGVKRED